MEPKILQKVKIVHQGDSAYDLNLMLDDGWRIKSVVVIQPIFDGKVGEAHYLLEKDNGQSF